MVKTNLNVWLDAEIKAKAQNRIDNLSAYIENVLKAFLESPEATAETDVMKLKDQIAALKAQGADLMGQLDKLKRKEAERKKETSYYRGEKKW